MPRKFALLLLLASLLGARSSGDEADASHPQAQQAADLLNQAINAAAAVEPAERLSQLSAAGKKAVELLGPDHLGAALLRSSLQEAGAAPPEDASSAAKRLLADLRKVHGMLTFKPVQEAETPQGFPQWTPVGEIEVKEYPAYRMARYAMNERGDNGAFLTLFQHIKKSDIAMTAPVEMEYRSQGQDQPSQRSMAFLYASTGLGTLGETPSGVEVVDVPAKLVLSVGMQGPTSQAQIEAARDALQAWLDRNQPAYAADGPLRVMGHNSPFVFGSRRYFEVQIPLRRLSGDGADNAPPEAAHAH